MLSNPDFTRANIDESTSLSLLTLAPKATVEIVNKEGDGQYLRFVVGGFQQTSNIAFHIVGRELPFLQEINHYENTLETLDSLYVGLTKEMLYLDLLNELSQYKLEPAWNEQHPGVEFIPDRWNTLRGNLEAIVWTPTANNILRARMIDLVALGRGLFDEIQLREDFIAGNQRFANDNLKKYINNFRMNNASLQLTTLYNEIDLTVPEKQQLKSTLELLAKDRFEFTYDTTVDELRERI